MKIEIATTVPPRRRTPGGQRRGMVSRTGRGLRPPTPIGPAKSVNGATGRRTTRHRGQKVVERQWPTDRSRVRCATVPRVQHESLVAKEGCDSCYDCDQFEMNTLRSSKRPTSRFERRRAEWLRTFPRQFFSLSQMFRKRCFPEPSICRPITPRARNEAALSSTTMLTMCPLMKRIIVLPRAMT